MTVILITGPSRSGKSEWAEQLTDKHSQALGLQVTYVATATTSNKDSDEDTEDREWRDRIQKHIQRRPTHWQTKEIPTQLSNFITQVNEIRQITPQQIKHCLLIDSLGTWLANLIEQNDEQWEATQAELLQALEQTMDVVILVAEETGWGVVPAYELGRRFRDRLGSLSRAVGAIADDVYLVTSGYALNLSTLGQQITSNN